jgi:hypothetical protein
MDNREGERDLLFFTKSNNMDHKAIHKFDNGRNTTLCIRCRAIIIEGHTDDLYCDEHREEEQSAEEWLDDLPLQTLTDELKSEIIEKFNGK